MGSSVEFEQIERARRESQPLLLERGGAGIAQGLSELTSRPGRILRHRQDARRLSRRRFARGSGVLDLGLTKEEVGPGGGGGRVVQRRRHVVGSDRRSWRDMTRRRRICRSDGSEEVVQRLWDRPLLVLLRAIRSSGRQRGSSSGDADATDRVGGLARSKRTEEGLEHELVEGRPAPAGASSAGSSAPLVEPSQASSPSNVNLCIARSPDTRTPASAALTRGGRPRRVSAGGSRPTVLDMARSRVATLEFRDPAYTGSLWVFHRLARRLVAAMSWVSDAQEPPDSFLTLPHSRALPCSVRSRRRGTLFDLVDAWHPPSGPNPRRQSRRRSARWRVL